MNGERKLTKCENAHFYDADKFLTCPHCEAMKLGLDTTKEHFRRVMGEKLNDTVTESRLAGQEKQDSPLGAAVREAMERREKRNG